MIRSCWCSAPSLTPFTEDYLACVHCGTLVSQFAHERDVAHVSADESDLYGKNYWFDHMEKDLGFTNIYQRARTDLSERCLYWLRALLDYRTPPAHALELGSAHGGFVAALSWAGFDASGLELSPSIAQIARELYGVNMLVGPIEDQDIPEHSLDIIALMDVLEHLPDPVTTVRHCVSRLKRGGVLLIQTPQFPEGQSFEELSRAGNRFLEMLKPNEHLYLFSERSVRLLFEQVGFTHFVFEPALFSHYDMFFLVSDAPIARVDPAEAEAALVKRPDGRLMQALLDLRTRLDDSVPRTAFEASELDREARLRVMERQGNQLGEAAAREASLLGDVDGLRRALDAAEADREARLRVIERHGSELRDIGQSREALASELDAMRQAFEASELDRAARLRVIERQGQELGEAEQRRQAVVAELDELRQAFKQCDDERSAHLRVIEQQQERALKSLEQQVAGLQAAIERIQSSRDASESARMEALAYVDRQTAELLTLTTALEQSGAKISEIEQSNKEMKQVINQGIFQLIFNRLRGRN